MLRIQRPWRLLVAMMGVAVGLAGAISKSLSTEPASQIPSPRAEVAIPQSLDEIIEVALGLNPARAAAARQALRDAGPAAVDAILARSETKTDPAWQELLDATAQQKDARYSGLYWYTDLDAAIAAAQREQKPILSLRLLGKLTDELSCANSRFFRTTLYPNVVVRDELRRRFVLHWQSVRAVPLVTIDFGDGRTLQRTITGNSLHLILDKTGRAVDVVPGLYAASEFLRILEPAAAAARTLGQLDDSGFLTGRCQYHRDRMTANQVSWREICQRAGLDVTTATGIDHAPAVWSSASKAVPQEVLDAAARQAVAERAAPAEVAGRMALTKAVSETPLMRLVRNVTQIIGEDSVRNEYYFHAQIHQWLAAPTAAALTRETLVPRVYAELFLNPVNDPWYGLSRPDIYSALKNDGRTHAPNPQNAGD